jgi:hypothetical protein
VEAIDKRLHRCFFAGIAAYASFRSKQRSPRWLDDPVNRPLGMREAQCRYSRKGMKDVAHGAKTDHEQAKLGLRLQILIFSQRSLLKSGVIAARLAVWICDEPR